MSEFERLKEEILLLADGDRSKIYALLNASIRRVGEGLPNKRYVTTQELKNSVESVVGGNKASSSIPKGLDEAFRTQHKASFLANTFSPIFDGNSVLQLLRKKKILYKSDLKSVTRPITLLRRIERALKVLEGLNRQNAVKVERGSGEIILTTKQEVQRMLGMGVRNKDIARHLGVTPSYVSKIKREGKNECFRDDNFI